jgi:hypothetical protein
MKIVVTIDSPLEQVNPMSVWSALEHVTEAYRDFLTQTNRVDGCFTVTRSWETATIKATNLKRDIFGHCIEEETK